MEAADRGCIMYVMEVEAGHLHLDGERTSIAGAAAQHARTFGASAAQRLSARARLAQTSRLMVGCMSLVRPP